LSVFARGLSAENADRTFHSVSERRECFEVFSPDGRGASGDTFCGVLKERVDYPLEKLFITADTDNEFR